MPDLRTSTVLDWLQPMRPRDLPDLWPSPIRPLERSAQAEALLAEFGLHLDQEATQAPGRLAAQLTTEGAVSSFQQTIAQLGAARAMRLMHWFRETQLPEGVAAGNAIMRGETQAARAIRACVTSVARQATLARLMSQERLEELASAAQAAMQENT
jgi:hypothetical protein